MRQREDGQWTWKADGSLFNIALPDMTDPDLIGRYWKAVETIPCPILEVRGAESILVSDDTLKRMKEVAKEFDWIDVAGAGHVVTVGQAPGVYYGCYLFPSRGRQAVAGQRINTCLIAQGLIAWQSAGSLYIEPADY